MERIFIGVKIAAEPAAEVCSLFKNDVAMKGVKWIPENNLHITLRFIGEVNPDLRQVIASNLNSIRVPPFAMTLAKVGHFPKRGPLRIIHVGVDEGERALIDLKKRIDEILRAIDSDELTSKLDNKSFQSHITIARLNRINVQEVQGWISAHNAYQGPSMVVTGFQLFRSNMQSHGVEYEVLHDFPLTSMESEEDAMDTSL